MARATFNGVVVAECERTEVVEGNHYFPPGAVRRQFFRQSPTHTVCSWKGTANYFSLEVNGIVNPDAAWYYPDPKPAATKIKDHVAFWKGVRIEL